MAANRNIKQVLKFFMFSVSAGVLELLTYTVLSELFELPYWGSYLPALILSVLYNFTLNRSFTFRSANNVPIAMMKVALYYAVFTPLSTWGGQQLEHAGWNEYLILGSTMLINLVTEFLYCRIVVYRGSIDTNARAQKENQNNQ